MIMETNTTLPKCTVKINVIVGIDKNGGIGYKNKVLFDCPEDKLFYEKKTANSIVVMGRGTFESLQYKVMPNRLNIVISSTLSDKDYPQYTQNELIICQDFVSVINYLNETQPTLNVFIIGGESVYKWFIENDYVNNIYLNLIDKEAKYADRFFPDELYLNKFKEISSKAHIWLVDKADTTVYEKLYSKI